MNYDFLKQLLESDIGRPVKERIIEYWLLPPKEGTVKAPIQKAESDLRVGSIRRPSKEELDLRADPKKREGIEAMEHTLEGVVGDEAE